MREGTANVTETGKPVEAKEAKSRYISEKTTPEVLFTFCSTVPVASQQATRYFAFQAVHHERIRTHHLLGCVRVYKYPHRVLRGVDHVAVVAPEAVVLVEEPGTYIHTYSNHGANSVRGTQRSNTADIDRPTGGIVTPQGWKNTTSTSARTCIVQQRQDSEQQ